MATITINEQLASLRKQKGMTQEELARIFNVTNQSVSKWESGASCPDISVIPDIAEYFDVSIDTLFGKTPLPCSDSITIDDVPWDDDDTIRIIVFHGKTVLNDSDDLSDLTFNLEGEIKDVECRCNLRCGNISGNASAGCDIHCGDNSRGDERYAIGGQAVAGCDIHCGNIYGGASAGCDINGGNIADGAKAASDINCGNIDGGACAEGDINCGKIEGDVSCGGDISCQIITGNVECDGDISYA